MKTALLLLAVAIGLMMGWQVITDIERPDVRDVVAPVAKTQVVSRFDFRAEPVELPDEIPVYEVVGPMVDREGFYELMKVFGLPGEIGGNDVIWVARDGGRTLEASLRPGTGYLRYTDEEKLLSERRAAGLLSDEEAIDKARDFLEEHGWLPEGATLSGVDYYEFAEFGANGELLDEGISAVSVIFEMELAGVPVEGPGAKCSVAFGDYGELVGAARVWRDLADPTACVATVSFDSASQEFKARWPEEAPREGLAEEHHLVTVVVEEMYVAYYAEPGVTPQEMIEPVLVFVGYSQLVDPQGKPVGDVDPFWQKVPLVE